MKENLLLLKGLLEYLKIDFTNILLQYQKMNVHIDKTDDILNKYSDIYLKKIKMKPTDVISSSFMLKTTTKVTNLKSVTT